MRDRIDRLRAGAKVKLNLGCGPSRLAGSINLDLHGSPDVCADARSLPFPDSSFDWLESHHMLEHFTLQEGEKVIEEWARVLQPGGVACITVPDFCKIHRFMNATKDMVEPWKSLVMFVYGQDGPGMQHKSAYTPVYLTHILSNNRFDKWEIFDWPYRPTPSFGVLAWKA